MTPSLTAVIVVYGVDELDLRALPPETPVVLVHNDDQLSDDRILPAPIHSIEHVRGHGNVGFGPGANLGMDLVRSERVVFCNPDASLCPEHWEAIANASSTEVVSVPMIDGDGRPASVVNAYPTPFSLLLTGFHVGRLAGRGTRTRAALVRVLGRWGRMHSRSARPGQRPLSEGWCSGAIFSVDAERFRSVGGFDEQYFLYFEDVDLCRRLADRYPEMTVRVASVAPAHHAVGGSARDAAGRIAAERHMVKSAITFALSSALRNDDSALAWRVTTALLRLRARRLARG